MIEFDCPRCGQQIEVDDGFAGRQGRCPACRRIVTIPGETVEDGGPASARPEPAGGSAFGPDLGDRAPKKWTVPESVLSADAEPEAPPRRTPEAGRAHAFWGLGLGLIPVASFVGIIVGAIGWSQAKRSGTRSTLQLARAATGLAVIVSLLSIVLGVMLMIDLVSESIVSNERQGRLHYLQGYVGREIENWAGTHAGEYPPDEVTARAALSGGYYYSSSAANHDWDYVAGLKKASAPPAILVYDAEPAYGHDGLLADMLEGRIVYRTNGMAEFLTEEQFQREMAEQSRKLGKPPAGSW